MTATIPQLIELKPSGELRFNLHRGQAKALRSTARTVALVAGTQSGKTSFCPLWLWREIQRCGAGSYGFVTPSYPLLELKALPEFRRLFEDLLMLGSYTGSPVRRFTFSASGAKRTYGTTEPTTVYFGYAESSDSLESATYKAVVADEAGQKTFKRSSYEALRRRLAIHQGRMLVATTPYTNIHWLKDQIIDKAGTPEVDVINFSSLMNPAFPKAEFDEAQATLPWWKFSLFYLGQLERPAGMIYDCFTDTHKVARFVVPPQWKRYVGLDFGGVHTAAILLAEDPATGHLFAYREYLNGGLTSKEHAEAIQKDEPHFARAVGGSLSEGQWRAEFRAGGLAIEEPDQPLVEVRIDRLYAALKARKLFVFDDLSGLIKEFMTYSRKLDENGQPTEVIENKATFHRLDALGYVVAKLMRPQQKASKAELPW